MPVEKVSLSFSESFELGQMVDVLLLARELVPDRVEPAVRGALAAGAHDGRAARRPRSPTSPPLLEAEVQERAERRERRRLIDARFPLLKRA